MRNLTIILSMLCLTVFPLWAQPIGELTGKPLGERCLTPPLPLQPRLENRNFPSVFSAWGGLGWSPVLNQPHLSDLEQMTQHDLYWCCLMWNHDFYRNGDTLEVREVVRVGGEKSATHYRDLYISENPNMIFLVRLRAVWEPLDTFPEDSDYWLRGDSGERIIVFTSRALLNLNHPDVQKRIIDRGVAVSECGLYDGVFFDGWSEWHANYHGTLDGSIAILKGIRERVDDNFLILVNTNQSTAPLSAPYINGLFLESGVPGNASVPAEGFRKLEDTLSWAEENLRAPQINALEGWARTDEPLDSQTNLRYMRTITTLSLTFSDSYVLFMTGFWEGRHMHWHYWYDFWDAELGRPLGEKSQLYEDRPGLYIREYTNGWAVYNNSGAAQIITLPEEVLSVTSGLSNAEHAILDLDGEIYLKKNAPMDSPDINGNDIYITDSIHAVPGAALLLDASNNPGSIVRWVNLGSAEGRLLASDGLPTAEEGEIEIPAIGFSSRRRYYTFTASGQTFGGPIHLNPQLYLGDWTLEFLCKHNGNLFAEEHHFVGFQNSPREGLQGIRLGLLIDGQELNMSSTPMALNSRNEH